MKQVEVDELAVIETYLPKQLSGDEVRTAINTIVKSTGAEGMGDMGKVMGAAMGQLKGKADGKLVQQIVVMLSFMESLMKSTTLLLALSLETFKA